MNAALPQLLCVSLALVACSKDADPASETSPTRTSEPTAAKSTDAPPVVAPKPKPTVVFATESGEARVELEVVATPALIQRGLMHRQHLAPDHGMIFVFGGDRVRSFWMKNTLIPLDMLFVTEDLEVAGIVRETVPLSLESRSVGVPTRYVIEVNGGWTAKNGVETGTKLRLENMPTVTNPPL